jgi:hypothetical protein
MSRILGLCLLLTAVTCFPQVGQGAYCADVSSLCATESPANCTSCVSCAPMYGYAGTCACGLYTGKTKCSCTP